jgi:hypothetical protein
VSSAELLLLTGSALAVFAASLVGIAVFSGRGVRVPRRAQQVVVPNAEAMGKWQRRMALAIAAGLGLLSQGLLLAYLLTAPLDTFSAVLVGGELALALSMLAYVLWPTRPPPA